MPSTESHRSWRSQARNLWRSDTHTDANLHLRDIDAEADRVHTREVIDLVMRIAELALATGASASETTAMVLGICDAHQVKVHVDITNTAVMVSRPGGPHADPITALRTVRGRSSDYQRLSRLEGLVHKLTTRRISIAEGRSRFNDIIVAPRTYRRWVVIAAAAVMGGAIAMLLGGGPVETVVATISAGLVDALLRYLGRKRVPQFFANMVAAIIPTAIAVTLVGVWPNENHPSPSIIVGAGIVSMLAGLNLVSAARDALDGYYITSGARIYEAMAMTAAIVVGVTLALWAGMRLGVVAHLSTSTRDLVPLWTQLACAGLIGLTFAVGCHAGPRTVGIATVLAIVTQVAAYSALQLTSYRPATAGFAAFIVAAVATWGAPRWKVPLVALVSSGLISQVPGSLIYRGLYAALQQDAKVLYGQDAQALLGTALFVGAALGIGANLGTLVARPLALPASGPLRIALFKSWGRGQTRDES